MLLWTTGCSTTVEPDVVSVELDDFSITAPASAAAGEFEVSNIGGAPHTFSSADGGFDSQSLAAGESTTITIEATGTFDYQCNIHPGQMQGTIEVG